MTDFRPRATTTSAAPSKPTHTYVHTPYSAGALPHRAADTPSPVLPFAGISGGVSMSVNTPMNRSVSSIGVGAPQAVALPINQPGALGFDSERRPRVFLAPGALSLQISPAGSSSHSQFVDSVPASAGGSPMRFNASGGLLPNHVPNVPHGADPFRTTAGPVTDLCPTTALRHYNDTNAFFTVGNMGPSSWQAMTPSAVAPADLHATPSSNKVSMMSTPSHTVAVAATEELPEADRSDTNLVIQHVPHHIVEADVQAAFEAFGDVTSTAVMRNIHSGESLGTVFVRFATHGQALNALRAFRLWIADRIWGIAPPAAMRQAGLSREVSRRFDELPPPPGTMFTSSAFDATFGAAHAAHLTMTWARRTHDDNTLTADERARVRKLFIRNVPTSCTRKSLVKLFRKYGRVSHISIHRDSKSAGDKANQRNIAFVVYHEAGAAELATHAIHNTTPFAECNGIRLMIKMTSDNSNEAVTAPPATASKTPSRACERHGAPPPRKERRATNSGGAATLVAAEDRAVVPTAPFVGGLFSAEDCGSVHRALVELVAPSTNSSPGATDALTAAERLNSSLRKAVNLSASHVARNGTEDNSTAASPSVKELGMTGSSGSATGSVPVAGVTETSSDPQSHTENSTDCPDDTHVRSDDFLVHAQNDGAARVPRYHTSPSHANSITTHPSQSITVTVRRGGRFQRLIDSQGIAVTQ